MHFVTASPSLPEINNFIDLRAFLGFKGTSDFKTRAELKKTSQQYTRFQIPKRNGDPRTISAPLEPLKGIQKRIYNEILIKLPTHPAAHGFIPGRSVYTNAKKHQMAEVLVNIDLKNFFPTIKFSRILGIFGKIGYNKSVSAMFADLCTINDNGKRLPQGAPTSPAISNQICFNMDVRCSNFAKLYQLNYTRYADDLTFSGGKEVRYMTEHITHIVKKIAKDEGFEVNEKKIHRWLPHERQAVTGLVVNEGLGPRPPRDFRRKLKAIIHNCYKHGIESQATGMDVDKFIDMVNGMLGFIADGLEAEKFMEYSKKWQLCKMHESKRR